MWESKGVHSLRPQPTTIPDDVSIQHHNYYVWGGLGLMYLVMKILSGLPRHDDQQIEHR